MSAQMLVHQAYIVHCFGVQSAGDTKDGDQLISGFGQFAASAHLNDILPLKGSVLGAPQCICSVCKTKNTMQLRKG